MLTLSWFITPTGEAIFADDVNYPLKVAGFESTLPGWFWVTGDSHGSERVTAAVVKLGEKRLRALERPDSAG